MTHVQGSQREQDPEQNENLQDFYNFYNSNKQRCAISPDDSPTYFFPLDLLKGYFSLDYSPRTRRILQALLPDEYIDPKAIDLIARIYTQVFAILLLEGCGRFILPFLNSRNLSDQYLPFRQIPQDFPPSPTIPLYERFRKRQWELCAPRMDSGSVAWSEEYILPITEKQLVGNGAAANTFKIKIHPSYNDLDLKQDSSKGDYLVMKVSDTLPTSENQFSQEIKGFRNLRNSLGANTSAIIHYYGSFVHARKFYILLEHADGGNLEGFLRNSQLPRPSREEDIAELWNNLFALVLSLGSIHSHRMDNAIGSREELQGWHQDIKPQNILVVDFCQEAPWKSRFKLADLGLSHFEPLDSERHQDNSMRPGAAASQAARTYGAPECYQHGAPNSSTPRQPDKKSDVWSMGAVFSEVAVWMDSGPEGLNAYQYARAAEIHHSGTCRHQFAFHDGSKTLRCVQKKHRDLRQKANRVTVHVISIIASMLWPIEQRVGTVFCHRQWEDFRNELQDQDGDNPALMHADPAQNLIQHQRNTSGHYSDASHSPAIRNSGCQLPTSPTSNSDGEQLQLREEPVQPSSLPGPPNWPYPSALQWDGDRKAALRIDPEPLGIHKSRLRGRDHYFLIDDSPTMRNEWDNVKQNAELLINILFHFHADREIDLCFVISDEECRRSREHADHLIRAIERKKPRQRQNATFFQAEPSEKLSKIVKSHMKRANHGKIRKFFDNAVGQPLKPLSIYILTDGLWNSTDNTESLIRRLIKEHPQLQDIDTDEPPAIGIQLVRFGNHEQAQADMEYFDSGLNLPRDIVDTEPWNGNVAKLLLGPISRLFDNDPKRLDTTADTPTSHALRETGGATGASAEVSLPHRGYSQRHSMLQDGPLRRSQYGSGRSRR